MREGPEAFFSSLSRSNPALPAWRHGRDLCCQRLPLPLPLLFMGVFTGILSGTTMTDAIAQNLVSSIPDSAGHFVPLITALLSAPMTFFLSNDAFYFGVVPILAEASTKWSSGSPSMLVSQSRSSLPSITRRIDGGRHQGGCEVRSPTVGARGCDGGVSAPWCRANRMPLSRTRWMPCLRSAPRRPRHGQVIEGARLALV